ncbi:hypothetical protein ACFWZ2_14595 [Streptomyces sp. NPDC059002]|uniref:hypothetical protein n=1 Tax=Streptomyces sp. NPDC059002 TaxID=3346690 RepID=UPI0036A863CF
MALPLFPSASAAPSVPSGSPSAVTALPASCTGDSTPGADTIVCSGNLKPGDTIDAGDGADTITVKGDIPYGAKVLGGRGADTVSAYDVGELACGDAAFDAKGGLLDAGEGDDKVTIGEGAPPPKGCADDFPRGNVGAKAVVRGGAGKDTITAGTVGHVRSNADDPAQGTEGLGGRIDGGAGEDTIKAEGVAIPQNLEGPDKGGVYGGDANDRIVIGDASGLVTIDGEGGDDTLTVRTARYAEIRGGAGNDTLTATQQPLDHLSGLYGDDGDDTLTVTSLHHTAKAVGGKGNDRIKVTRMNGPDDTDVNINAAYVAGGGGDDSIEVGMAGRMSYVLGGPGKDTLKLGSVNGPADKILPEEKGYDPEILHSATVMGGPGPDSLDIGVLGKWGKVRGGAGTDTIRLGRINASGYVDAGEHRDTVTVNGPVAADGEVLGAEGPDVLKVTGRNDGLANGGPGRDLCRVGSGNPPLNCELR